MSLKTDLQSRLVALVTDALPYARVELNRAKDMTLSEGGIVNIQSGDPGQPFVDLSPLTYTYQHELPVEVAGFASASMSADEVLDALLMPINAAVDADRSLGGLVTFLSVTADTRDMLDATGAQPIPTAAFSFIAEYSVRQPLG